MTASTSMSHHEAVASIIAAARTSLPDLVDRVAHRAAQGVPLAEMLTAYRMGVAELWSALITAVRAWRELPHS
jgi:hypothetical protein